MTENETMDLVGRAFPLSDYGLRAVFEGAKLNLLDLLALFGELSRLEKMPPVAEEAKLRAWFGPLAAIALKYAKKSGSVQLTGLAEAFAGMLKDDAQWAVFYKIISKKRAGQGFDDDERLELDAALGGRWSDLLDKLIQLLPLILPLFVKGQ